jgi:hypothetical protein
MVTVERLTQYGARCNYVEMSRPYPHTDPGYIRREECASEAEYVVSDDTHCQYLCPEHAKPYLKPAKTAKPKTTREPSMATMIRWMDNGIAKATDGCKVEPDGHCPHGCASWLIVLGLI